MLPPWLKDAEQFILIFTGLFCMGAGTGFERSLLPRMAVHTFHEYSAVTRLNFVATFGLSKAIANAVSGPISDKFGRKPTLVGGFLIGLPVMPFIIIAQSWTGITFMNILFGFSQGLLGSALFFLLIDLMGPTRRGIAVGLGECTIYVSTALINILAGKLATEYGYRPVPFYVATAFSIIGLVSTYPLQDTLALVQVEQSNSEKLDHDMRMKYARMASIQPSVLDEERELLKKDTFESWAMSTEGSTLMSYRTGPDENGKVSFRFPDDEATLNENDDDSIAERDPPLKTLMRLIVENPNYTSLCFAGLVMNFKDGFAWGSFPVFFSHEHMLSDSHTDMLVALYPLCWGFAQAFTGALSDHFGRKLFLVAGTASCAIACALYAVPGILWGAQGDYRHVGVWIFCDVLLGLGTALAYPALQAGAADEVDPVNRGLALGFYRFVRDFGYVIGALVCGSLQDAVGYEWTFIFVALVMTVALLFMALVYKPTFDPHDFESVHMNMQASPPFGSLRDPDVSSSASRRRRRPEYVNKYSDSL